MQAVPPLVTFAVMIWGIGGASYWRDEAATLSAVERPFTELLRMLGHIDAVLGAYYVIMWPVVRLAGPGELATRLPSALAMAAAAAAVAGLGRHLVSPRAGLIAGLVFAVLPQVSLYGQTTRPYAMATALAAAASYLLVRAMQGAVSDAAVRGWLTGYAACLAALGFLHAYALLLIAAHSIPVARAWQRATGRAAKSLAVGWLAAVACAVVLVSPVVALGIAQRPPVNRLTVSVIPSIIGLPNLIGPDRMVAAVVLTVLCAVMVGVVAGRARLRADWPGELLALCLPWLILPAAILIGISLAYPAYIFRYIVFCAPAAALLIGAGLAALGWGAGIVALAIITALAVPAQVQVRSPGGHGDNIRQADRILSENMRPGDVMLYPRLGEPIAAAYSYGFRQLKNVELAQNPIQSGTLGGTWAPPRVVRQRLSKVSRVWLVQFKSHLPQLAVVLHRLGFNRSRSWHTTHIWLVLYIK